MATATDVDLHTVLSTTQQSPPDTHAHSNEASTSTSLTPVSVEPDLGSEEEAPVNAAGSIPEGGYGWTIVSICALLTFWFNGISGSWGVVQAALLRSQLTDTPTSTISFVGTLGLACVVAFGLFGIRLYFMARLGLASGLVKFGGGSGATVLAVAIDAPINRVGIPWTYRILGLCSLATSGPAV
ncbi:uncharacterized protein A1O5_06592 [Cladophialophora psammophila CBS 110553]|uniref:Major facilitator superfamily (MFS) profile domain-containing protein n=1 Tax=Cladophialophora psammophila CBS 110553 TaxID=1182543 RepID=W9WQQ0_9EURO|nr:uncharacterized protein A1O5_06592 [Cladophialophora psammophila CBS 110553]EXJ70522.1 hypothetical protein A1O5_06592 [Cladophialophora psammophila CBS 110553]